MSGWIKQAVCACGRTFRTPFGTIFGVWEEVCPGCGADKHTFKIRVMRWVPAVKAGPWYNRKIVEPAHWEFKD